MGNANSSHSSRTPRSLHALDNDPSWSNIGGGVSSSYPRPRGVWQHQQQQYQSEMMEERQQQQQQHRSLITDYETGQSGYDHFDQECVRELNNKMASDPGRFSRYGGPESLLHQQPKKIKVLPTAANGGLGSSSSPGSAPPAVVKLRATDNGLALQKVGTLHIANRKLTELHHGLSGINANRNPVSADHQSTSVTPVAAVQSVDEDEDIRSPTPDYDAQSHKQRGSRPRSKKKSKAPTAPSTPAASARSDGSTGGRARSRDGTPKRSKLRLFKTKSDAKSGAEENGRIRARSMEYLRADLADETQEIRRRRHSREDLSGDESLLAITKTGPVTVFSSQKKLNSSGGNRVGDDDDDWEEMPRVVASAMPLTSSSAQEEKRKNQKEQFYFGMTPGDVAVAVAATVPTRPSTIDLDEESRRVMEEFDAVLAEKESRHSAHNGHVHVDEVDGDKENNNRRRRRARRSSTPPSNKNKTSSSSYHDDEDDDDEDHDSIALNLRPTLPKKPQQLPRFSPSAAWRALGQQQHGHQRASSGGSRLNVSSSKASDMSAMDLSDEDEDDDVMEDRINKNQLRPVAPHQPRNINEKSADSGISGDAGSPDAAAARGGCAGAVEKPLAMSSPVPQQQNAINSWTPQQDLQDDDDDDDCSSNSSQEDKVRRHRAAALAVEAAVVAQHHQQQQQKNRCDPQAPPKIIPKSQMFNDSMTDTPGSRSSSVSKSGGGGGGGGAASRSRKYRKRNEASDTANDSGGNGQQPQKYNSLRKLKRSVSGAFATAFRRGSRSPSDHSLDDGNWVLSRSAPNSILNGSVGESASSRLGKFHRSEADLLASGGPTLAQLAHQYPAYSQPSVLTQRIVYLPQYDSRIQMHQQYQQQPLQQHHPRYRPRSSTDHHQVEMMRRARSADAVYMESNSGLALGMAGSNGSCFSGRMIPNGIGKKFTFQSTVRVNEKRMLEERLSREAELKERKRLQEQVAMQRVEEEFQRKRAREKANIRQQLRILQHSQEQQQRTRLDPEGAPSSSAASHNRTSSDEFQSSPSHRKATQQQQMPLAKKKDPIPTPARKVRSQQQQPEVVVQRHQQQQKQQQRDNLEPKKSNDYRKEVIINSRTRSAAPPPPTSGQAEYRLNSNGVVERNNNAAVVTNYKKSTSNIYKRLAEITSEEESISSPPPVPILATSSPVRSSASGSKQQRSTPPTAAVTSSAIAATSSASGKVMTQELSEYRQERREYRDYRSPRHYQQQLMTSAPPLVPHTHIGGRYANSQQQQRVLSTGVPSSASSQLSTDRQHKIQSNGDNYRWDFAHGGRGHHVIQQQQQQQHIQYRPAATSSSSSGWHHPQQMQHQPTSAAASARRLDYHQYYKMTSPGEVVIMHRNHPAHQQRYH